MQNIRKLELMEYVKVRSNLAGWGTTLHVWKSCIQISLSSNLFFCLSNPSSSTMALYESAPNKNYS
jgi:hypothetical protein